MDDLAIDTIRDYKANIWRIKEMTERSEEVGSAAGLRNRANPPSHPKHQRGLDPCLPTRSQVERYLCRRKKRCLRSREAIKRCHGCDLYRNATQAVFGELGTESETRRPKVAIMMIGERRGDQEDQRGRPFVGPAGKLLDRCLEEAEIDRRKVYVSNISNGSLRGNSVSIRNQVRRRFELADHG